MDASGALSSLASVSLPLEAKELSSRKKLSSLTKSKLGLSSLLVSEDEVEGFSSPFEGRRGNQTSLVKV